MLFGHFGGPGTASQSEPVRKTARPSQSRAPKGGRSPAETPAARLCGRKTSQPHAKEMNQKANASASGNDFCQIWERDLRGPNHLPQLCDYGAEERPE